jgi:ABC-type transport system involved in cytochrome bd biosynthesis fused ATPase/permease subunit
VPQDGAELLGAQRRRRLGARNLLGAHDLALFDEAGEQLRLRERPPILQALARQRAEDLAVGVEDRAVRVAEGPGFDLRGAQGEDSV